jgi:hypothetical protein
LLSDSGRTLAENFGNIEFAFNFSDPAFERVTMIAMVNLVQSDEQLSGPITLEQHAHLITLIEKRLPPDSQIQTDYFVRRGPRAIPEEIWRDAMTRFHRCVGEVRLLMKKYDSYGPPTKLYRFQATTLRTPAPSALAPLARRSAAAAAAPPPPRDPICCPSCGHLGHDRPACPHRYQSDANNDTTCSWADSHMSRKWLAHGQRQYEVDLILPGFEERYSTNQSNLASTSSSKHARFDVETNLLLKKLW